MGAMTGLSRINFEALAEKFDFSPYQSLCDIGGATGLLCIEVAKRHPHLTCTSFDLPPVEPISATHSTTQGPTSASGVRPWVSNGSMSSTWPGRRVPRWPTSSDRDYFCSASSFLICATVFLTPMS